MKPVVPRSFRCPESGDLCTDGNCTQTLCRAETRALARMSSQVTLISSSARDLLAASFFGAAAIQMCWRGKKSWTSCCRRKPNSQRGLVETHSGLHRGRIRRNNPSRTYLWRKTSPGDAIRKTFRRKMVAGIYDSLMDTGMKTH